MNVLQRLAAATPAQEKRVQVICLILECAVAWLIKLNIGSQGVLLVIAGLLAGIAAFAQYAVEDVAIVENAIHSPSTIGNAISALSDQFLEIKGLVTSRATPDVNELSKQILAAMLKIAAPDTEKPIEDSKPADEVITTN